jgi:hypothetical protein
MTSLRDYKIAITFLFIGFIISSIVFLAINVREWWTFSVENDLNGMRLTIKKQGDVISGLMEWAEDAVEHQDGMEEAYEIIFGKPFEPTRAIKVEEGK